MAPSLKLSFTSIPTFKIVLTRQPNSPTIDLERVISVAEAFLDNYFKTTLSDDMRYRGINLQSASTNGRRLQSVTTVSCRGEVRFNLFNSPDEEMITETAKKAFEDFKPLFIEDLNDSGIHQILDVRTTTMPVHNAFSSIHLVIILSCVSTVVFGVAASYTWKRTQENNIKKRLLRAAEYTHQYRGQPQIDDDCFRDIEPEPIQISDDNKALERMVMRARHDRGVMNRANEFLVKQIDEVMNDITFRAHNKEVRFAPSFDTGNVSISFVVEDGLFRFDL